MSQLQTIVPESLSIRLNFEYCDRITIALGHGFECCTNPRESFDLPQSIEADLEFLVIDDWARYENLYAAFKAIQDLNDDILLSCCDVVFYQDVLDDVVHSFRTSPKGLSTVGAIKGIQTRMTAISLDESGYIDGYGSIEGQQDVGLSILSSQHLDAAREFW